MGPLPPNLVSVQPRDPSSRSAGGPCSCDPSWLAEPVLDPEAQERQCLAPPGGVASQLAATLARVGEAVLANVHDRPAARRRERELDRRGLRGICVPPFEREALGSLRLDDLPMCDRVDEVGAPVLPAEEQL